MKLRILTWIHDRKLRRARFWPVLGVARAYAVGYVEGERHGPEEELLMRVGFRFGAYHDGRWDPDGRVPRAYSRGRRAGAAVREERKQRLRVVA